MHVCVCNMGYIYKNKIKVKGFLFNSFYTECK